MCIFNPALLLLGVDALISCFSFFVTPSNHAVHPNGLICQLPLCHLLPNTDGRMLQLLVLQENGSYKNLFLLLSVTLVAANMLQTFL